MNTLLRALIFLLGFSTPAVFSLGLMRAQAEVFGVRCSVAGLLLVPILAVAVLARKVSWRSLLKGCPWLLFFGLLAAGALAQGGGGGLVRFAQVGGLIGLALLAGASLTGRRESMALVSGLSAAAAVNLLWALGQTIAGNDAYYVRGMLPTNAVYSLWMLMAFPCLVVTIGRWKGLAPAWRFGFAGPLALAMAATFGDFGYALALAVQCLASMFFFSPELRRVRWAATGLAVAVLAVQAASHPVETRRFFSVHEYADVASAYARGAHLAQTEPGTLLNVSLGERGAVRVQAPFLPLEPAPPPDFDRSFDPEILKQRLAEWIAAVRMAADRPLLGVGLGNYQANIGRYYSPMPKLNTSDPDTQNGWLVVLSSIGFPATALLAILVVAGACAGAREIEESAAPEAATAGGLGLLGLAAGGFWAPFFQTGLFVPLGLLSGVVLAQVGPDWASVFRALVFRASRPAPSSRLAWGAVGVFLLSVAIPVGAAMLRPRAEAPAPRNAVYLWLEAEDASRIQAPMELASQAGASRGGTVRIPEGVGAGWREEGGGSASWVVDVPAAGEYSLWARTWWEDACGNAFFLKVNDGPQLILGNDADFRRWHWVGIERLRLSAGENTLLLSNREDGVHLDKLLITNDPTFVPKGAWDVAFAQRLDSAQPWGWIASEGSAWETVVIGGETALAAPPAAEAPAHLLVIDHVLEEDLIARGEVYFPSESSEVSLLYLHENAGNYFAFDLSPGEVAFRRVRDGQPEPLASAEGVNLPLETWNSVELESRNGVIVLRVEGEPVLETVERRVQRGRVGLASAGGGGAAVRRFTLEPNVAIGFRREFSGSDTSEELTVGDEDWSNYVVSLEMREAAAPIGLTVAGLELVRDGAGAWALKDRFENAIHSFSEDSTLPLPQENLSLRCFEHEVVLHLDGREAGRVPFSPARILKGPVEVPALEGVAAVDVRGIRRFYDGFGGCDGNNSASWTPQSGRWQVMTNPAIGSVDSFAQLAPGKALALAGEGFWQQYDMDCLLRHSGHEAIGFIYAWQDVDNHRAVRWERPTADTGGRLRLVETKDGVERELVSAPLDLELGRWYELAKRTSPDGAVRVLVDGEPVLEARGGEDAQARGKIGLFSEGPPGAFFDNVRVDFF
ncbi:MAG: O-antigen ligase family protein [Sumerlaeia bacterium]